MYPKNSVFLRYDACGLVTVALLTREYVYISIIFKKWLRALKMNTQTCWRRTLLRNRARKHTLAQLEGGTTKGGTTQAGWHGAWTHAALGRY